MIIIHTGGTSTYIRPDHISSVFHSATKVRVHMLSGVEHSITDKDSMTSFMNQFEEYYVELSPKDLNEIKEADADAEE